jgi:hypothetical protein
MMDDSDAEEEDECSSVPLETVEAVAVSVCVFLYDAS